MKLARSQLLLAVGLIPCMAVSLAALFIVPWFSSTFAAAGVAGPWLPLPTRILAATYRWWGIAALLTVVLWLTWPIAANRGKVAAAFGVLGSVLLFALGVVGCYAPLFALASGR